MKKNKELRKELRNSYVNLIGFIISMTGLLFGMDMAYVNGSLKFIIKDFHVSTLAAQAVAGELLLGAAIGAMISGVISKKFGRKYTMIVSGLFFTIFTYAASLSPTFGFLLVTRFLIGIAVGIASFVGPVYLSEMAPASSRGALISLYQLMITIGIFLMFFSNVLYSFTGSWRTMLLVLTGPSTILFMGAIILPKSPRWLMLKNRKEEAKEVLYKIHGKTVGDKEFIEIEKASKNNTGILKMLKKSFFIKVVLLGLALQALQQFSGMNAFMYYSTMIFKDVGIKNSGIITVIIGFINVIATIFAIKYIDKIGRKKILYIGLAILIPTLFLMGAILHVKVIHGLLAFALIVVSLLFIVGFAISLGPVVWTLCSEIFPLEGRDLGVGITTTGNWIFNTMLGSFTLTWIKTLGIGNTFWMFGLVCVLGVGLVYYFVPETKNIELEKMEENLRNGVPLRKIGNIV